MKVILRNDKSEIISQFPLPLDWAPAPDVVIAPGQKLFSFCGLREGFITYRPATWKELPEGVEVKQETAGGA